jgi:hypothetical protein
MVNIDKIIDYENGSTTEEQDIEMFQEMVDDGSVWQLQGSYGRTAMAMIKAGLITTPAERKMYGNT